MREIVSTAHSWVLVPGTAIVSVLSLTLVGLSVVLVIETFGRGRVAVLGLTISCGFFLMALLAIAWFRTARPHRVVIERSSRDGLDR